MANQFQEAGNVFMGLSAGLGGRGLEFQQMQLREREKRKQAEVERKKTVFTDSLSALNFAKQGRYDLVTQLGQNRLQASKNFPDADFSETQQLVQLSQLAEQGNQEAADNLLKSLDNNVQIGRGIGVLGEEKVSDLDIARTEKIRAETTQLRGGKAGKTKEQIEREIAVKENTLEIRRDELNLRREQSDKFDLTPTTQKILDTSQNEAFKAGESARELELLADDMNRLDIGGGAPSTVSEKLKVVLGSTEAVSDLRRRFRGFRSSRAIENLPPGVASDKDIELALSGFPPENANNATIISFLKGQSKLARIQEGFNLVKSDLISTQGNTRNLLKRWKKKINDSEFQASLFSGIEGISTVEGTGTAATFQQPQVLRFDAQGNQIQ